jgi:senataxin
VEEVLVADIQEVTRIIKSLCFALARIKQGATPDALPTLTIRTQMWKKLYSTSSTQDTTAIANIICIVAKAAHMDSVRLSVFSQQWKLPEGDQLLDKVNQSLHTIQSGFLALISTFSDYGVSTSALDVLRRIGAGKAVIMLLLSPIEDFQTAARTLIGLAFDVDGRMDCFRALLENLPVEALDGIFEFLVTFERHAATLPEACSLSQTLVRCFTDIVEVLCTSPDGLLQSSIFLRSNDDQGPAARMPQLWKLMTKALSTIYKRTPMWAPYFDTPDMVVWMRDALILARDMLSHWRVIENAANTFTKASAKPATPGKVSRIGQEMIGTLQEFLPELVRWLRLTDEELLHQSFALLQSLLDLMKNVHVRPSETGLSKLRKHVEGAMTQSKIREDRTRLDSGRLAKLAHVLAYFDEEDEVEIVSHVIPSQPLVKEEKIKSVKESRPYIQGKAQTSKITGHFPKASLPYVLLPSSAKTFSEHDRKTLESQAAIPSFRPSTSTTPATSAGSSKTISQNQRSRSKNEPKNEAAGRSAVSESSDSSESNTDEENLAPAFSLSSLGRISKSPRNSTQKTKQVERRQIKTLDIPIWSNPMQDRILRQKRERNAALRLRPDISDLHRVILSWDYNHVGPEPSGGKIQLTHVPDRFESYEHYFRVFQPLLLMECWAQLVQSKEEKQDYYPCKVESRLFSDDWLDIDLSISESVRRDWYLAETDIVLLRQLNPPKCTMAKVKSYKALSSGIQFTIRCYTKGGPGDPGLQVTTLWQIGKVFRYIHSLFCLWEGLHSNKVSA